MYKQTNVGCKYFGLKTKLTFTVFPNSWRNKWYAYFECAGSREVFSFFAKMMTRDWQEQIIYFR